MLLVVGLGNPGEKYAATRHNIGFSVVEHLASLQGASWKQEFSGECARCDVGGERMMLLKPMTFMNRSGTSVQQAAHYFKVPTGQIWVVHDDMDIAFGDVRLKVDGGEAGHNGLRSISQNLGSRAYGRVRVGVGKPPPEFAGQGADYVLRAFASEEKTQLDGVVERASDAILAILSVGVDRAMNQFNQKKSTKTKTKKDLLAPSDKAGGQNDREEQS